MFTLGATSKELTLFNYALCRGRSRSRHRHRKELVHVADPKRHFRPSTVEKG